MAGEVCQCPEPVRGTLPDEFLTHVQGGDVEKIKAWLTEGEDVNAATEGGQTLLSAACVYQRLEVVQMLLEDPQLHLNTKHRIGTLSRFTPLCIAANKGLHEIVSAFLESTTGECHLDVGATTSKGKNALMLAAEKGHWEVVETLCPQMSVPEEDNSIVSSLARWANRPNILNLLQRQSRKERNNMDDMSVSPSERIYVNDTSPRGLVLILNYKFESDPEHHRKGTDADAQTLHRVFRGMDYETEEHCDLSYPDTLRILDEFRSRDRLREFSCVVVVVLSHGLNKDTFATADGEHMKMKALRRHFTDEKCPHMSGKPKIFLLQFCRGGDIASQVNRHPSTDDIRDASTDMMCLYAAQEGFESFRFEGKPRDPFAGTPFIKSFCQVLETKGNIWLDDLLREFIDDYSNTQWGQPLDCQNLSFKKKFCFNPSFE